MQILCIFPQGFLSNRILEEHPIVLQDVQSQNGDGATAPAPRPLVPLHLCPVGRGVPTLAHSLLNSFAHENAFGTNDVSRHFSVRSEIKADWMYTMFLYFFLRGLILKVYTHIMYFLSALRLVAPIIQLPYFLPKLLFIHGKKSFYRC